jgi:hypothetical protein
MHRRAFIALALSQVAAAPPPGTEPEPEDISIIALIANPANYTGKRVRLIGFLNLEFEGNGLFVGKQDFDAGITKNAIWIDEPAGLAKGARKRLSKHYVLAEGVFNGADLGHLDLYSGALQQVRRLEIW